MCLCLMQYVFTEKGAQIVWGAQVHRMGKEFAERILNLRQGNQSGHMVRFKFDKEIDVAVGLRIPVQTDHGFRRKLTIDSMGK